VKRDPASDDARAVTACALRSLLDDPERGVLLHDEGPDVALGRLFEPLRPALATAPRP